MRSRSTSVRLRTGDARATHADDMLAALTALVSALAAVIEAFARGGGVDLVLGQIRARLAADDARAVAERERAIAAALAAGRVDDVAAAFARLDARLDALGVLDDAAGGRDRRDTSDPATLVD